MKKFASKSGFTLVELIVVIAILGILAAVAVPTYTGYMTKAKEAGDMQTLSSVATAVQGVAAGHGVTVDTIVVTKSSGAIAVTETGDPAWDDDAYGAEVTALLGGTDPTNYQGTWTSATMEDGQWTLTYPAADEGE